ELTQYEEEFNCKIISSPLRTTQICLSKLKTYQQLKESVLIPTMFNNLKIVNSFPVFMKPEIGYGSRGAKIIKNKQEGEQHFKDFPESLILEYLPGREFTVDCFTDKDRNLLF